MTSPLSFSSRLCSKSLKRLSYSCQCLLTCVCLLCTGKVCRWKFFHCLCDFLQQFTWVYSSVKWVINLLPHIQLFFFFLLQLLHSQLLYVKSFLIDMSALTLIWQAQQQQHQQQQQCKCHTGMCLRADSSQGPHSLWCICCRPHFYDCWCWFSSLCWSAAACSVHSLSSDKSHSCTVWCECFVYMTTHHIEPDKNSSAVVHQCDSDLESKCVGFCQLCQLSGTQYGAFFKMSLYVRTFQWVLW